MGRVVGRKEIYAGGMPEQLILEYAEDGQVGLFSQEVTIHCFSSGRIKSISITSGGCSFEFLQEAIAIAKDWAEKAVEEFLNKMDAEVR